MSPAVLTVRALRAGYHGKLREPGEIFRIAGRRELGSWMEVVGRRRSGRDDPPPPAAPGSAEGASEGEAP